jgi:hypothetical protein
MIRLNAKIGVTQTFGGAVMTRTITMGLMEGGILKAGLIVHCVL